MSDAHCVLCIHWSSELEMIVEDSEIHGPYPTVEAAKTAGGRLRDERPNCDFFVVLPLLPPG